jgi:hypothetical protein
MSDDSRVQVVIDDLPAVVPLSREERELNMRWTNRMDADDWRLIAIRRYESTIVALEGRLSESQQDTRRMNELEKGYDVDAHANPPHAAVDIYIPNDEDTHVFTGPTLREAVDSALRSVESGDPR